MTSRKKKKKPKSRRLQLIGRLGPPQNLRGGGAHKDRRHGARKDASLALKREVAEVEIDRAEEESSF